MTDRLIIHAPNVHQGGGAALLVPLLSATAKEHLSCTAIVDRRLKLDHTLSGDIEVIRVNPTLRSRLKAEKMLATVSKQGDTVLCFGNLPPLFRLRGRVLVFLQNRYLAEPVDLSGFPWPVRLRISLERLWLRSRTSTVSRFIVQSPSMQRLLENAVGREAMILPFMEDASGYSRSVHKSGSRGSSRWDFLYVASGEPHKNHRNLIRAWCLLAEEGIRPSLCLTIPDHSADQLLAWIEREKTRNDLSIENMGNATSEEIHSLYGKSRALIYPSKCESLGLPLIEAKISHLPVLASELDYVRDVLDPEQAFDPDSPVSIARAVKRFMGLEEPRLPLVDAREFVRNVTGPEK